MDEMGKASWINTALFYLPTGEGVPPDQLAPNKTAPHPLTSLKFFAKLPVALRGLYLQWFLIGLAIKDQLHFPEGSH